MPSEVRPALTLPDKNCLGTLLFTKGIDHLAADNSGLLHNLSLKIDLFTAGDWGDLDEDDYEKNLETIRDAKAGKRIGGSLMGAYRLCNGTRIWVITVGYGMQHLGPSYCYTTVLLPEEY